MLVKGAPGGRVTDICRVNWLSLDQIMACRLFRAKPLSEPMQTYYQSDLKKFSLMKFYLKFKSFHSRKCIWKCCLQNGGHFVSASMCFKCWSITDTGPGGHLKNTSSYISELLNFHLWMEYTSSNVWVRYFVWNFKGYLWNSTQNNLPIHWKMQILYNIAILRALWFKSL